MYMVTHTYTCTHANTHTHTRGGRAGGKGAIPMYALGGLATPMMTDGIPNQKIIAMKKYLAYSPESH